MIHAKRPIEDGEAESEQNSSPLAGSADHKTRTALQTPKAAKDRRERSTFHWGQENLPSHLNLLQLRHVNHQLGRILLSVLDHDAVTWRKLRGDPGDVVAQPQQG